MIKKHNVNYHLRDLSFFKTFVEFCVKDVYSTIFEEHLQIFCVQITWKCIFRVKKLKVDFFNRVPPDDTPLQIFIMKLLTEENYSFSLPKEFFFFFKSFPRFSKKGYTEKLQKLPKSNDRFCNLFRKNVR